MEESRGAFHDAPAFFGRVWAEDHDDDTPDPTPAVDFLAPHAAGRRTTRASWT
ncbi:hypothetical protein [Saccharothrix longispora]|uniref:hypothetical protein n=1 Tax=Saccharothrix longispora TaxID=33920 RepID=UPI0028FD48E8|nr:hypothetical protein [Saccharothrix longispora]MBY8847373.1 hypothetical protein [Saccharothrix sp. MB29]MDU0291495.1 hypothetical protein [Saccharothrix longispora]